MRSWLQQRLKGRASPTRGPIAAGPAPTNGHAPGSLAEWWHFHMTDHGILRAVWSNFAEVAPGVWRSNQPSATRLARYRAKGLHSILNLRGESENSFSVIERDACDRLGIQLTALRMRAHHLPDRARLLELRDALAAQEKPFLIHCKSGADRTGFAAALYLLLFTKQPVATAKRQLHWRYMHFAFTRSGILDHFLDTYARAQADTGIGFLDWVKTVYDPEIVTRSFQEGRT